jgi:hypothetical protein
MPGKTKPELYDEEAAIEAAQERSAAPDLRDVLRREYDEILKGRPRDVALEKWGAEIEAQIERDLARSKRKETQRIPPKHTITDKD